MSENVFHVLKERGFIYQTTDEEKLESILGKEKIVCYIGFDATADSFHVGSLVPLIGLMHMQRAGHVPIPLLGGGTTLIGDPSGKTEMRKLLTIDQINQFGEKLLSQFKRFLSFDNGKALMLNNAEWLVPLNYIEFLRDIGRHFSVNRMLAAESYKMRLEKGLSFIEFNYMLLQAYDFYVLARDQNCILQMGGQDQWGNIVAGVDLTRRMISKEVFGMTFPLLMNSNGQKFGKTAEGAVWLDSERTSTYDFYQFWRNIDDADVEKCLGLFTFLPMEEVRRIPKENINRAKEILAFEVTKLVHSREDAESAYTAAGNKFGFSDPDCSVKTSSSIISVLIDKSASLPVVELNGSDIEEGLWVVKLFTQAGLCSSNGEARRLIKQGGAYINDKKVESDGLEITKDQLVDNALVLRAGKKRYKKVIFSR